MSILRSYAMQCAPNATYNPRWVDVSRRTTRSVLTASERSTARGMITGMIGTTGEQEDNVICI